MKLILSFILCFILSLSNTTFGQVEQITSNPHIRNSFSLVAVNPTSVDRPNELVEVDLAKIKLHFPSFNEKAFFITYKDKEIPSQLSVGQSTYRKIRTDDYNEIIFISSFAPNEKKEFLVTWKQDTIEVHRYPQMTQAALGMKMDYKKVDGYYTGGRFVDVDSTTVPPDHFAHDALYRIEGPGWESDKIVYRYYLDSRNRNDIFGKKTHNLVLREIGENDLVSDSKESYTNMLSWGMDIFKVGESLGIGSIAMYHDGKAITVSNVGQVRCSIFNGAIRSGVLTEYSGWKVGGKTYDLLSDLSISGRSRLTKACSAVNDDSVQLCTGLAKHDSCELITSDASTNSGWEYLALYGKQSLSGDNLGIAILYRKEDAVKLTEDSVSLIVVLRPTSGRVMYYFGAAWEDEPEGIKSEKEFKEYLDNTIVSLNQPIQTSF